MHFQIQHTIFYGLKKYPNVDSQPSMFQTSVSFIPSIAFLPLKNCHAFTPYSPKQGTVNHTDAIHASQQHQQWHLTNQGSNMNLTCHWWPHKLPFIFNDVRIKTWSLSGTYQVLIWLSGKTLDCQPRDCEFDPPHLKLHVLKDAMPVSVRSKLFTTSYIWTIFKQWNLLP